jgi:hypothetical protein
MTAPPSFQGGRRGGRAPGPHALARGRPGRGRRAEAGAAGRGVLWCCPSALSLDVIQIRIEAALYTDSICTRERERQLAVCIYVNQSGVWA